MRAVDGVSLTVAAGETLALVGEFGCGKSTVGRLASAPARADRAARVRFEGRDLATLSATELRRARAGAQLIFQDPYGSLNPRMTVGEMLAEPLLLHSDLSPAGRRERVADLLAHRRSEGRPRAALPPRVLRRPAPAHRHRPRARHGAQAHRLRRTGLRPRRLHPQPDPEPSQGPAAAPGARVHLHQPRPGGGEAHRLARGRHVPRAHRRDRRVRCDLRRAAPPLYAGPAVGGAGAVGRRAPTAAHPPRRSPERARPAARLPSPSALRLCPRCLQTLTSRASGR